MVRKLLGPVVLALVFPVLLAAQSQATTGVIRGTVTDPSGTLVAGATVVLHESQTGFQRQVATNERGVFIAPLMPLGTYDVTARAVGFGDGGGTTHERANRRRQADQSLIQQSDRFPIRGAGLGALRVRRLDRRFELEAADLASVRRHSQVLFGRGDRRL